MRSETELRQAPRTPPELDEEQEVDFGLYWGRLFARWWLPVIGLVAGILIGFVLSLGSTKVYDAQSIAYLGEPLAPGGGAPVSSPSTQLALASQITLAESTIRQVAAQVGLRPSQLRGHILARPIAGVTNGKTGAPAPILAITVRGRSPQKVAAAADALSSLVTFKSSNYVRTKINALKDHLAYDGQQIDIVQRRLGFARQQLQSALRSTSLGPAGQLISIQNFNGVIVASETRLGALEQDRFAVRQTLKLAQEIEAGGVLTHARSVGTTARSRRNSVLVGALIGLIIGIFAALLWDPIAARMKSSPGDGGTDGTQLA
jgi:hypothetical protein